MRLRSCLPYPVSLQQLSGSLKKAPASPQLCMLQARFCLSPPLVNTTACSMYEDSKLLIPAPAKLLLRLMHMWDMDRGRLVRSCLSLPKNCGSITSRLYNTDKESA